MAGQDVKIRFGGDFSDLEKSFDNAIKKIQADINKIKSPANILQAQQQTAAKASNLGYPMGSPSSDAINRANTLAAAQMRQRTLEEQRGLEMINRVLEKRKVIVDDLKKAQETTAKGTKEEADIKERLFRAEERERQAKENFARRNATFNTMLNAQQQAASGGGGARGGGGGGFQDFLKHAGGIGGVTGAIESVIKSGLSVYRGYGEAPIASSVAQGSAMQGTFGRELQAIYSGRSPFENAFMGEKGRAAQMAVENLQNRQRYDTAGIYGGIGTKMMTGAAAGGIVGGPMGALGGGAVGGIVGVGSALMDPRQRARMLGEVSPRFKQQYESMNAQEFAQNYQSAYEAEKNKNPLKTMAAEEYQQNYQRNLDFQRSTGMNFNTFHGKGGFRESAINAGFTDTMGMGMAGGILGAGGSTQAAQQNSVLGLQMQRGMNMTNAGNIIGQLSGSMGGAGASRDATIHLLAEGTRLGFDSTKFAEENRQFTEAAAGVIARSGATGESVDTLLDRFGQFFGTDKSRLGIEAGMSAYQQYQGISTASTGPRGVIRAAGMLESFGDLSLMDRMSLSSIPENQLTEDNPSILAISKKTGKTPREIVEARNKIDENAIFRTNYAQKSIDAYRAAKKAPTVSMSYGENLENAKNQAMLAAGAEFPEDQGDRKKLQALVERASGGSQGVVKGGRGAAIPGVEAALTGTETGKIEDRTVAGQAEASRLMLQNFQTMSNQIAPTAEAMRKFNEQLQKTVDIVMKMPEAERSGVFSKLFPSMYPKEQTQAGRPNQ